FIMINDILITGVGGQGTVLASRLIAAAALEKGYFTRTAETIGMAQRGGSVVSHVRIDSKNKNSLIFDKMADSIIAFEPCEAVRCLVKLKDRGKIIVNLNPIVPVVSTLGGTEYNLENIINIIKEKQSDAIFIDGNDIAKKAGNEKAVNVVLLGVALKQGLINFEYEFFEKIIEKNVPEKFKQLNLRALKMGFNATV
ncbi:MAG: indolepyruvate oxidoreductase subunit beta, partial [Oscillospiraceae bacterium]